MSAVMTQACVGTSSLPQNEEAVLLRGLNISPGASQERLEYAAEQFSRTGRIFNWVDMPTLLANAWGETLRTGRKHRS